MNKRRLNNFTPGLFWQVVVELWLYYFASQEAHFN